MERARLDTRSIPQAPLVAKPKSTRNALVVVAVVVAVVAIAGFAATSTKQSPISAVAASNLCDTPTSGQTCGLTYKGTTSGFVEGHAYTPCYCSKNEGIHKVKVAVLGCLGKCDAGHQCPHTIHSYLHDTGHAANYPYPHVSILGDVPVPPRERRVARGTPSPRPRPTSGVAKYGGPPAAARVARNHHSIRHRRDAL